MKKGTRTKAEMYPIVEAYLESDQTIKAFSEDRAIPKSVFEYWLRKYRREKGSDSPFVEITPEGAAAVGHPIVEVLHPNGIRLRFFNPVAPSYLAALLGQGDRRR